MRMSMARKIYALVALLLVVTAVILGLGIHSMRNMTDTMHATIRQANRLNGSFRLEGVMSRKAQVVPPLEKSLAEIK